MRKGINTKSNSLFNRCDNYSTMKEAFDLLFEYIDVKHKNVWFPFYHEGLINTYKFDCNIIHNDNNFFETNEECDYIIDNPPFSIKEKIFQRCIDLSKPFCLLVPIDTLERQYISTMFKEKDFTIIIPKKRYNFINQSKSITMGFKCCWFCYKFNLGRNIIFE